MGSGVKQVGKAWHRLVLSEFELLGEQSYTTYTCSNSNMCSLLLPSHLLLFKWEEKWLNHLVAEAGAGVGLAGGMAVPGSLRRQPASRGLVSHCTHHHIVVFLLTFFRWVECSSAQRFGFPRFPPWPPEQIGLTCVSVCSLAVIPCSMPPERHSVMSKSASPTSGLPSAWTAQPPSSSHTR